MEVQSLERGADDDVSKTLSRLDGKKLYSLLLWKLPRGKSLDQTSPKRDADEYIQCAGSEDHITVEVRRRRGNTFEHFVVGRASDRGESGKKITIPWNSAETEVEPNEVLSAAEVAELFLSYYRTDSIPPKYVLRLLSL